MKNRFALLLDRKCLTAVLALTFAMAAPSGAEILIPRNSSWKYNTSNTDLGAAWRQRTYDDTTWSAGPGPLGAGDAHIVTTIDIGPAATRYPTIYFRRSFTITNASGYSGLTLRVLRDDGAIVYLNGTEVQAVNVTTPIAFTAYSAIDAGDATAEMTYFEFNIPASGLTNGLNVIAVEGKQATISSSDFGFDLELEGVIDTTAPTIVSRVPAAGAVVQQLNSVQIVFSEAVTNVDASDLTINGIAATNVIIASPTTYTWVFAQPATTGTVNIAFAPGHGIMDLALPPNTFAGDSWIYTLNTNIILPQFFITEFMADNSGHGVNGIRDEDGDDSDWIEIYNSDQAVGNIGGWFLTDASTNLSKWRIPTGTTIPGRGYLVVFASGKNRTNVLGRLHTNFQLNNTGEYLALSNPQTNVISQFSPLYPPQQEDISYGRDRVDINLLGFYLTPTPGSNNVTAGAGFGPVVKFSRAGGTFIDPFNLVLTTDDTNSVIRYTVVSTAQNVGNAIDIPTSSSTLYTGPIAINNTVQVRARAFPNNPLFFPGDPRTECYVQIGGGATNFVSDLPIVVIHTMGSTTISGGFPALDNSVIIECFDNDGGTSSLNKPPQLVTRGGINLRGSSTQGYPKSSFAVELWDEFNNDEEKSFLGLPKESDWVLYAPNGFDKSLMHNPIMHKFARDMGHYSSRTRFVEVFFRNGAGTLTVNTNATSTAMGDYYGVFVLEEKVKRDGNRVDIDRLEPEHTNSTTITGGWLLKIDRDDPNERVFNPNGANDNVNYQDPDGLEMVPPINPGRAAQVAYILAYFNNMNAGLAGNALTNIASTNHYSNYLDVDKTIDLNIVNVATMNVDGYRLSGYIYKERGGKLVFGPVWDVDRGLGTSGNGDLRAFNPRAWQAWDPLGASDYGTDFFAGTTPPGWIGRWFADVDFWQRWIDRYQNWRASALDTNHIAADVDAFGNELRQAQVREVRRWQGVANSDTSPRAGAVAAGGSVYTHTFSGTFQGEIDFQKRWLIDHFHFMDTNLLNRPTLNTVEGQVPSGSLITLTDVSGKLGGAVYYTLDGTDPRGFQGTTNPAAIRYTQPITITNNVRIRARAVNANHRNLTGITGPGSHGPVVNSPWSGDIASTYFITPPPLVITELMFHPEPSANPDQDPDDFEYVELRNIGGTALNLVGFSFTNGIDFTFTATNAVTTLAAGDYVLLVKNIAAFTSRYGSRTNIAGQFGGNFANEGERVTLVGPRLEPILDFVYSDTWYPLSDGLGFSLVIKNQNAPLNTWDEKTSWRISSAENGSPGVVDPPPPVLPVVLINEALTHTASPALDTIELYNPGTSPANIGGWYLTDDPSEPKKYQIPANFTIPAGGYALFDELQFGAGLNGFCLSAEGDDVYLFSAIGGSLSGYAHGFNFGPAPNGVTFGRYVNSQGEEHFVAQTANTLGATNSLPRVGPVVISEVMYHPPDTLSGSNRVDNFLDEFIELHNITSTNVPLFHTAYPTNTWRLTQAVDFSFPTNTSIGATSFVVIVNFDPATNANQVAAFRAKYGVSGSIPLFGPYSGKLDNSSESIRLRRPDDPATFGSCDSANFGNSAYIIVDQVDYRADAPWDKAADGVGASLQRLVLGAYGNDLTNWIAARPTPGVRFIGGSKPGITQQPVNRVAFVGGATNFSVTVTGVAVSVQWRFNGDAIPGATNTTLTLNNIQYGQAGVYDVVAFNAGGTVFSSNATLTVLSPLTISLQPASQDVQPGANVTITSAAFGSGTIYYQWQYEGTNVPGATNASFSFSNASLSYGHGNWRVVVRDDFGSLTSSNALIFVLIRPGYELQPQPQTVLQGQNATVCVVATGAPPIFYRWIRGGSPVTTNDQPCFTFSNLQANTSVRVATTNRASGPGGFNSSTVTLTVLADFDGDGMADVWEVQYGFNTNDVADGALDLDGDGMINRDEYAAGTDPMDPQSLLKVVMTATNTALLKFVAQTNLSYSLQFRTNLTAGVWTGLTNLAVSPVVRTVDVTVPKPPPEGLRFYRVITPVMP